MHPTSSSNTLSWKLVALLIALPSAAFVSEKLPLSSTALGVCCVLAWLAYMAIAIAVKSFPLSFMLLGMAFLSCLVPSVTGDDRNTVRHTYECMFVGGSLGFLFGAAYSVISKWWLDAIARSVKAANDAVSINVGSKSR